jgi:hypothetical protein
METCTKCGHDVDRLEIFPGGVCLACWSVSPEGRRMWSADELVAAFGGKR